MAPEVAWYVFPAFMGLLFPFALTPAQEPCLANAEERTTRLLENAELGCLGLLAEPSTGW